MGCDICVFTNNLLRTGNCFYRVINLSIQDIVSSALMTKLIGGYGKSPSFLPKQIK